MVIQFPLGELLILLDKMKLETRNIIGALLFFFGAYCFYQLYFLQQKNSELKNDYAEATSVKYGLFNPEIWKEKITIALYEKIDSIDLSGANKELVEEQITNALHLLVDQLNTYLQQKINEESNGLFRWAKGLAFDIFYDETKIRDQIPEYTEKIMQYIGTEDSKAKIKQFLKDQLDQFMETNVSPIGIQKLDFLKRKYQAQNTEIIPQIIADDLIQNEEQSKVWIYGIYALSVIIFILAYKSPIVPNMLMLGGMLLVWAPAIMLPMMSVGAELEKVQFNIIGTSFEFNNQTLFYQSKSILDLVKSLFNQDDISSIVVGFLVAFFSVFFPLIKIVMSFIYSEIKPENNFVRYLVRYGSKWSMADVFVVAIFMGFIGFRSIISHQLKSIEEATNFTSIETADLTEIHFPVFFFVTFVAMNIIASNKIIWYHKTNGKKL